MRTIITCFIFVIIVSLITGLALRLLVSTSTPPEVKMIRAIKDGDFFNIGRHGRTLILEVHTERTQDAKSKKD